MEKHDFPPPPLTPDEVKDVSRPDGTSDAFVLAAQKKLGSGGRVQRLHRPNTDQFSYQSLLMQRVAASGDDTFTHVAHEPRLEDAFAQSGWTPPLFEYAIIRTPAFPDTPKDKEVIPAEQLAQYAKYGLSGAQLDYVRQACREEYMRGETYVDMVCKPKEDKAPVPMAECYVPASAGNKPIVVAACGFARPNLNDNYVNLTLVPAVINRLLFHLRERHLLDALPLTARRKQFGTVEYTFGRRHRDTHGTTLYMRLAPMPSKAEDKAWKEKGEDAFVNPTTYVLLPLETAAHAAVFGQGHLAALQHALPVKSTPGAAPDLKTNLELAKKHKKQQEALEAAFAREREQEEAEAEKGERGNE